MSNQSARVLNYMLNFGSISSMEAFRDLGVTRLSAVIFNLKRKGFNITSTTESTVNRFGESVHYSRYTVKQNEYQN
jgi:hypothetical protein